MSFMSGMPGSSSDLPDTTCSEGKVIDFWFVRHAPTVAKKGIFYGWTDWAINLEEEGSLLKAVRETLPQNPCVYVSDLKRTRQTGKALGLGRPVAFEMALREQNFGDFEGKSLSSLGADHDIWRRPHSYRPPGGEAWIDVRQRVRHWLERLEPPGSEVVVLAHAGSLRAIMAEILCLPDEAALRLQLDTLSVSRARLYSCSADHPASPEQVSGSGLPLEREAEKGRTWSLCYMNWRPVYP